IVLVRSIVNVFTGSPAKAPFCDASNGRAFDVLNSTVMIFTGSNPLFKGGGFAGTLGISGDGIDQDDIISTFGGAGFEPPPERRIDRFFFRGIRIPYHKFPKHPNRGEE